MGTTPELIEHVKALCGHADTADNDDEFAYRVTQLLNQSALEELARAIAADRRRRNELRATPGFALAVTDGEASLSTLLAAPYRVLLDFLPEADIRDEDNQKLFYLGRDCYDLDQPNVYGYFTLEGNLLLARLAGENPSESDFTAILNANFVPSLDEVVPSCVPDLAAIIASHILGVDKGKKG